MRPPKLVLAASIVVILGAGGLAAAYFLDPGKRLEAVVRGYPTFQGRSASAWADDLNARDDLDRSIAFERLKGGKADAVPVVGWVLRSPGRSEARWQAADILGQLGADGRTGATDLIAALDDADPYVKAMAVKALARLAPAATESLPPELGGVVPALLNKLPETEVIRAVSDYKRHAAGAVPKLTVLLAHPDPAVRWNAARALGKIGESAKPATAAIVAQLADPVPLVREHAAEALGDIGPAVADAIPDLVKSLADPEWKVRKDAVRSLGQMGPAAKSVLARVQAMKADPEAEVREKATVAERQIDPTLAGEPKR